MTELAGGYEAAAAITLGAVRGWTGPRPLFAFPSREIAILADLRDIGARLARNAAALSLVNQIVSETVTRTGCAATAMMLRVCLDECGIPFQEVALSEIGLDVPRA